MSRVSPMNLEDTTGERGYSRELRTSKREAKLQGKCEVGDVRVTATSSLRTLAGMTMHRFDCPKQHLLAKQALQNPVSEAITLVTYISSLLLLLSPTQVQKRIMQGLCPQGLL